MENTIILPMYKTENHLKIQKMVLAVPQGIFYWFTFFNLFSVHWFSKYFQNASKITFHLCCCIS